MNDWLSFEQVLGYVAGAALLTGYSIKNDKRTKLVLIMSSLLFSVHFYMLGAFSGCAIMCVNAMRNACSVFWYKSKKVFLIFAFLYISSGYITYNSSIDLLPLMSALITCIGMFLLGGIRFRAIVIIPVIMWIIHNIVVGSIGGTIQAIILFFISLITVWRLYQDRKLEDKKNDP